MDDEKNEANELRGAWAGHVITKKLRERLIKQVEQARLDLMTAGLESTDPAVRERARQCLIFQELVKELT